MAEGTGATEPGFIAQNAVTMSVALGATSIFLLVLSVGLVMRNNDVFGLAARRKTYSERRLLKMR
jgi:hypothetical protein